MFAIIIVILIIAIIGSIFLMIKTIEPDPYLLVYLLVMIIISSMMLVMIGVNWNVVKLYL